MMKQPIKDTACVVQLQQIIDEPDVECDLEFDNDEERPLNSEQINLENVNDDFEDQALAEQAPARL